jgi:hypothetical protein
VAILVFVLDQTPPVVALVKVTVPAISQTVVEPVIAAIVGNAFTVIVFCANGVPPQPPVIVYFIFAHLLSLLGFHLTIKLILIYILLFLHQIQKKTRISHLSSH